MTWFAIDCNIWTNPKVHELANKLGITPETAICRIGRIWSWAMLAENETGDITHVPDSELASIARWTKKPEFFINALIECGFLENRDGRKYLHDWASVNGRFLVKMRKDRERKSG